MRFTVHGRHSYSITSKSISRIKRFYIYGIRIAKHRHCSRNWRRGKLQVKQVTKSQMVRQNSHILYIAHCDSKKMVNTYLKRTATLICWLSLFSFFWGIFTNLFTNNFERCSTAFATNQTPIILWFHWSKIYSSGRQYHNRKDEYLTKNLLTYYFVISNNVSKACNISTTNYTSVTEKIVIISSLYCMSHIKIMTLTGILYLRLLQYCLVCNELLNTCTIMLLFSCLPPTIYAM